MKASCITLCVKLSFLENRDNFLPWGKVWKPFLKD